MKVEGVPISWYESAVRANRQVSTVLRSQGMSEYADRFAYRSQVLQRNMLWQQSRYLRCAGSVLLELIAGYGNTPIRSFVTYAVVVLVHDQAALSGITR
jgi:hypothetical protein